MLLDGHDLDHLRVHHVSVLLQRHDPYHDAANYVFYRKDLRARATRLQWHYGNDVQQHRFWLRCRRHGLLRLGHPVLLIRSVSGHLDMRRDRIRLQQRGSNEFGPILLDWQYALCLLDL